MRTITERERSTDEKLVPKWSTVVAIASKVNEPLEERKNKEKEATKLVKRLEADRRERERIRKIRAEENQLRIVEGLKEFEKEKADKLKSTQKESLHRGRSIKK